MSFMHSFIVANLLAALFNIGGTLSGLPPPPLWGVCHWLAGSYRYRLFCDECVMSTSEKCR